MNWFYEEIYKNGPCMHKFHRKEILEASIRNPILNYYLQYWRSGDLTWTETMEALAMYFVVNDNIDRKDRIKKMEEAMEK